MRPADEARFRDFAAAQALPLRRQAYLLSSDWHLAEDLVQDALLKLYRAWPRLGAADPPLNYARRTLVRTWLDERRRPWRRREDRSGVLPDPAGVGGETERVDARGPLLAALARLAPRQRAVLVLRYFCGLSVPATAAALGISEGTVKSQSARGLDALRAHYATFDNPVR
ncbi:SigE family RNA polymerase sigma factor [Actinokineospora bangkokensis]|uniref:RNA polymerase subunit sigma-24 n=1 Tax=Actinokineospora bangkokensis TaxID=1193682 RepID=A0A1Q9LCA6_9PSEU|nr:SigE family RNA polymerase sigma factor [Actinokineospora bangkokensis]OLR89660.1 RNA polymerase subunit sigma-24 [Actinokineospora bangkokensis]